MKIPCYFLPTQQSVCDVVLLLALVGWFALLSVIFYIRVHRGYQGPYKPCILCMSLATCELMPWFERPTVSLTSAHSEKTWLVVFQGRLDSGSPSLRCTTLLPRYCSIDVLLFVPKREPVMFSIVSFGLLREAFG